MLSKCANPDCSTPFLHLRDGKLFHWDAQATVHHVFPSAADPSTRKPDRKAEYFWLCGKCALSMTVVFKEGIGITIRPLGRAHKKAS
jgi:hypothetical protein